MPSWQVGSNIQFFLFISIQNIFSSIKKIQFCFQVFLIPILNDDFSLMIHCLVKLRVFHLSFNSNSLWVTSQKSSMWDENYIIEYQTIIRDIFFPKKIFILLESVIYQLNLTKNANQLIAFQNKMQICNLSFFSCSFLIR